MKNKSATIFFCLLLSVITTGCVPRIFWANYHKDINQVDSLLAAGSNINAKYLGHTILIESVLEGNTAMVKMLLQRGADPTIRNTSDPVRPTTPLQDAERKGYKQIVQLLQEAEDRKNGVVTSPTDVDKTPAAVNSTPEKVTISVMDLKVASGLAKNEVVMLTDKLQNEIVANGCYKVVERSNRDEILKEQGFQQSGACDQGACLVEAGQLLGVQKMVGGTIGKLGTVYAVELRVMDVKTGEIDRGFSREYSGGVATLLGAMRDAAAAFSGIRATH